METTTRIAFKKEAKWTSNPTKESVRGESGSEKIQQDMQTSIVQYIYSYLSQIHEIMDKMTRMIEYANNIK